MHTEVVVCTAVQARLLPPSPPRREAWRDIMEKLSSSSCDAYRCMPAASAAAAAAAVVARNRNVLVTIERSGRARAPEVETG